MEERAFDLRPPSEIGGVVRPIDMNHSNPLGATRDPVRTGPAHQVAPPICASPQSYVDRIPPAWPVPAVRIPTAIDSTSPSDRAPTPAVFVNATRPTSPPAIHAVPARVMIPPQRSSLGPLPPWQRSRVSGRAVVKSVAMGIWRGIHVVGRAVMASAEWLHAIAHFGLRLIGRFGHALGTLVTWIAELNYGLEGGIARIAALLGLIVSCGLIIAVVTASVAALPSIPTATTSASSIAAETPALPIITPTIAPRHARVVDAGTVGLIVRATPAGRRIGKLANGMSVEVVAGPVTIADSLNATWWQVRHGALAGWVSGRFLTFER